MKIHKVTLTVIDFEELGAEGVRDTVENAWYPNRCISPKVLTVETKDIGEWHDDHPLNKADTAVDELNKLFKN